MKHWKPLYSKKDNSRILNKLHELLDELFNDLTQKESINFVGDKLSLSLMGGKSGISILFLYYASLTQSQKYHDAGIVLLEEIINDLETIPMDFTFARGITGVAWTLNHLLQKEILEEDTEDLLKDFDLHILEALKHHLKLKNYDYLYGAVGIAHYFASRLPNETATTGLNLFIKEIDKNKIIHSKGGIKFPTQTSTGEDRYNLGISHGIPAIIAVLNKLYDANIEPKTTSSLIKEACSYILTQKLNPNKHISIFPSVESKNGEEISNSRLGWCYGDLGIGNVLLNSANLLNLSALKQEAIEILKSSTTRIDMDTNSIFDTCFCHGTAGVAHIYNRIYQTTGDEVFRIASKYWLNKTLDLATFEDGISGFKTFYIEDDNSEAWMKDIALLHGATGIGLSLCSAVSDSNTAWDEAFLLS
ncbi:MAG: lanthionine synthetase C family protein [Bacteroidales bacterium]|nr:lanthionine synthetase C family protein [Bacteroidales bacterium]